MKECPALPQRIFSVFGILALATALTAMLPPMVVAQQAAPSEQQESAQPLDEEGLEPLPSSPVEIAERDGTAIYLSLNDIIKLALQNNIDIVIASTNEESDQQSLKSAQASYDPTLRFTSGLNSSKSANTRLDTATDEDIFTTNKSFSWNINYSQPVKTGGSLSASWQTSRSSTNELFSFYNPNYSTSGSVSFTQPLWKNLTIDSSRSNIKITKLNMETTDITFKQTVTSNISRVSSQYWALVSAIRDYDIQRNSVKLAMINLRDNRKRVDVGTQAPITIIESEYQLAQRKQSLNSAEETIERQLNTMRQYVSNDRNNEIWSQVIVPTDTPEFQEYRIDLETAIETALKNRSELLQSDLELKKSDIQLAVSRNNRKWGVDLQASFGSRGSAGDPGDNLDAPPEYVGGVGTAYNNLFTQGLTNWSLQVTVNVPLRNRSADASHANQLISRQRLVLNRRKSEQQIQVEIRNAIQALQTSILQVETAKLGKELAEEQLDGENKRYDAGLTENYRVLERQDQLASAENSELRSLINYKNAIITLQEAMNVLLDESDFEIAKSSSEHIPDLE